MAPNHSHAPSGPPNPPGLGARWQSALQQLHGEQWFALWAGALAVFVLRSLTPLSFTEAPRALLMALLLTLPLGWALVGALVPGVRSSSARAALIVAAGYAASVLLGFFLGVLGLQAAYLPACLLPAVARGVWLSWRAWRSPVMAAAVPGELARLFASRPAWFWAGIACLSTIAVTPVLAPLQRVTPDLFIDYSFTDNYFHLIRAQLLSLGAPLSTSPELAGLPPYVYPDFHNFWIGQVAHLSGVDVRRAFFIYVPIVMVWARTLILYAVGRQLTGSAWGGLIGAALAYLVLIPNPYDANLFFNDATDTWPIWTAARVHFLEFRSNPAYGVGWQILSALALILALLTRARDRRTRVGLLTLGSLVTVVLLRIRPHMFVVIAPVYLLILLAQFLQRRQRHYLLPLLAFGVLLAALYLESTSSHYNTATTELALRYGPFGRTALPWLPALMRPWVANLPPWLLPLASVFVFQAFQTFGFGYAVLFGLGLVQRFRRRAPPSLVEVFLVAVTAATFSAALVVVFEAWLAEGGNWGSQVSFLLRAIAILLALPPLWQLARAAARALGLNPARQTRVAWAGLVFLTVITYRAASATLHNQTHRAYPISSAELDSYYWVAHNTPPTAVVAAHPDKVVSSAGHPISMVSFLSGMTLRPAYAQFSPGGVFSEMELRQREDLVRRLHATHSVAEARALLATAAFDYLLVYADIEPQLDLSCCLDLVWAGEPKIYHVRPDPSGVGGGAD